MRHTFIGLIPRGEFQDEEDVIEGGRRGPVSRDPERDAREILETVWDSTLPVDPIYIARSLGVKVYNAPLSSGVSGMLEKTAAYADPEITLNMSDSRNRRRFTCAHELGHYVMRSSRRNAPQLVLAARAIHGAPARRRGVYWPAEVQNGVHQRAALST